MSILFLLLCLRLSAVSGQQKVIWEIGKADKSSMGMALAPSAYKEFLAHDFGWEDRYYLVGYSKPEKDWPYILPGPQDAWAGTGPTSGIRSQVLNVLFGITTLPAKGNCHLNVAILGYHATLPPLVKIVVNGRSFVYQLPQTGENHKVSGDLEGAGAYQLNIPIKKEMLHLGGNEIQLTSLDGAWLVFDQLKLMGPPGLGLSSPKNIFLRSIKPATYQLQEQHNLIHLC